MFHGGAVLAKHIALGCVDAVAGRCILTVLILWCRVPPSYPNLLAQVRPVALGLSHYKFVSVINTFAFLGPWSPLQGDPLSSNYLGKAHPSFQGGPRPTVLKNHLLLCASNSPRGTEGNSLEKVNLE